MYYPEIENIYAIVPGNIHAVFAEISNTCPAKKAEIE
jgi:hypothetical protein